MWRPDNFDSERIAKENLPLFKWGSRECGDVIRGIDIGADAILEALMELAKESPTGTFIIDSHTYNIYEEK